MAKPIPKCYTDAIAEYQTGLYSVSDLARKYKVKRGTLASYISKNNITISNNTQQAILSIDRGLEKLKQEKEQILSNDLATKEQEQRINALNKGFEYLEARHGLLAKGVVDLVGRGFKKSGEMLEMVENSQDLLNTMKAIKTGADTLGLFPKSPLVAIQNNINKEINQQIGAQNLQIEINFIDKKEKSDIIDAETIENEN